MLQGRLRYPFSRVEGILGGKIFGSDKQIYNRVTHRQTDKSIGCNGVTHTESDYWIS